VTEPGQYGDAPCQRGVQRIAGHLVFIVAIAVVMRVWMVVTFDELDAMGVVAPPFL
jgi:uncharacterized membrane protein